MFKSPSVPMRQTLWLQQRRLLLTYVPAALVAFWLAACGSETAEVQPTPAAIVTVSSPVPSPAIAPTLQTARDAFAAAPLTLTFGDKRWTPQAEELGATIEATNAGLQVAIDQAKLQAYLGQLATTITKPAVSATVSINDGAMQATPAQAGTTLDEAAALSAITGALQQATAKQIALTTKPIAPAISDAAAEEAIRQAQARLDEPLTLKVGAKTYSWPSEILAALVRFTPTAEGKLALTLDQAGLAEQLATLSSKSEQPAQEPRVAWNDGQLQITTPGKDGSRIDQTQAIDMIQKEFTSGNGPVSLPLETVSPQVSSANLNTLGIREVVATGKSDFTDSAAYRVTNIVVGMKILDGVLIAPGAEFSFNNTVGEIDERNGFVEGHAIVNNRTQLEFGGGICQDSTTVFRAAFWAGLPITERKEHTFYISWYNRYGLGEYGDGPGLDATIYTGVQDLRFVNDTGAWMLMQARANPKTAVAQVTLYGTKPNRTVSLTQEITKRTPAIAEPEYYGDRDQPVGSMKRTDTARGGMTINVYRTVSENGVARDPELFRTVFRPWPNKYAVNPADIGPDGIPVFLAQPTAVPTEDPALVPAATPGAAPEPTPAADAPSQPPVWPTIDPATLPTIDPALLGTPPAS